MPDITQFPISTVQTNITSAQAATLPTYISLTLSNEQKIIALETTVGILNDILQARLAGNV